MTQGRMFSAGYLQAKIWLAFDINGGFSGDPLVL